MLGQNLKEELKQVFKEDVLFDEPLSNHTSIRIGGPADVFLWVQNLEQLKNILSWAKEKDLPCFVMGKGSNTLVKDGGFRGVVLSLTKGFRQFRKKKEEGDQVFVEAEGGVPTQQLVRWSALEGFEGLERLAGVPGTVGGNVIMNAGTYLGSVGELVEEVRWYHPKNGEKVSTRDQLKFEYRRSNLLPSAIVLKATFQLKKGDPKKIEEKIREVFDKRGFTQPIEYPNLGSIFKNVGKQKAWELIEEAGCKGVRVGKARISDKHANFIINEGGAKAEDVLVLIRMIKDRVKQASGLSLETEIKIIGEER